MSYKIIRFKNIILLALVLILSSCSKTEPRKPIVRKTGSFLDESVKRNKEVNKIEENVLKQLMQNDSLHHYTNSQNGFWYYYQIKDSLGLKQPIKGDKVVFTYDVKNLQKAILFSKEEVGNVEYVVDKQELITGLQDGIKLMKEGEIVTFLFPSYKAYGYSGNERVKPNQSLIFTVELIKINKNANN